MRKDQAGEPYAGDKWARTLEIATACLRRWSDEFTRRERDDLVQEVAMAVWRLRSRDLELEPRRWFGLVRTISHRTRLRALETAGRRVSLAIDAEGVVDPCEHPGARPVIVHGVAVSADWMLDQLGECLRSMHSTNRALLLAYYDGKGCTDLARRFSLTEEAVKVRLHRGRTVLRQRLEARIRVAGLVES